MKLITDLIEFPFKANSNPTIYPIFKSYKLISNSSHYFSKIADEGNINTNHSILLKQVLSTRNLIPNKYLVKEAVYLQKEIKKGITELSSKIVLQRKENYKKSLQFNLIKRTMCKG